MARGPDKQFDPEVALAKAMEVFWAKGYAAAGLTELQQAMGIGRKSLYDTFGNKRSLYVQALRLYAATITAQMRAELTDPDRPPLENVRRVLRDLGGLSAQPMSSGCLLGVGMAQCRTDDEELAAIFRAHVEGIEDAFHQTFLRARDEGALGAETDARDLARLFTTMLQGLALVGRVHDHPDVPRSVVDGALATLDALAPPRAP